MAPSRPGGGVGVGAGAAVVGAVALTAKAPATEKVVSKEEVLSSGERVFHTPPEDRAAKGIEVGLLRRASSIPGTRDRQCSASRGTRTHSVFKVLAFNGCCLMVEQIVM